MTIRVEQENEQSNLIKWYFEDGTTWSEFHLALDELQKKARETDEPFSVIAYAGKAMPSGNALTHLRRLIQIVQGHDTIEHFIIINRNRNPVGQAFVKMALRLVAGADKVHLTRSEEDADNLVRN